MLVLGIILICIGIALSYVFNYYHNVRKTNEYGVVEVAGLGGYLKRLLATGGITLFLLAIVISGIALIFASFTG